MAVQHKLPRNSLEEWLAKQKVKHTGTKAEVRIPPDIYEVWLQKRVASSKKKPK
jgi:hypothetical protein